MKTGFILMNIIIVGCGKVGTTLVENLSKEDNHISVIDLKSDEVNNCVNNYDVLGFIGNGSSNSVLMEAGIDKADLFIAVTGSDSINLLCCVIARKKGHCSTIARVRDSIYSSETKFIRQELGITKTFNPELASALEIARLLRFPNAIEIDTFAKGLAEILRFVVPDGSPLDNMPLYEINSKLGCKVLICAVERGDEAIIPNGSFIVQSGDKLSMLATEKEATNFFKHINITINHVKSVMIIGGGEIAYYLARQLQSLNIKVVIIEKNPARCDELCSLLDNDNIRVVNGDGSSFALLTEEGIDRMDAFVALTDIDEENIILSMSAHNKVRTKVVTKINRTDYNEVLRELPLDSIIIPKKIAAEYILRYVRARQSSGNSNVETLYKLLDNRVEALEFIIQEGSKICNIQIKDMALKKDMLIVGIHRNGKIIIPSGADMILPGDSVIIVTSAAGMLRNIEDIRA